MFSIFKVSRPPNPTRDFIEAALFYWFSKYGFKCARVERNGIDFLAKNPTADELLGIAIRNANASERQIVIPLEDLDKARTACLRFGCALYFALHLAQENEMWVFVVGVEHLIEISPKHEAKIEWSFNQKDIDRYLVDPAIVSIEMNHKVWRWLT